MIKIFAILYLLVTFNLPSFYLSVVFYCLIAILFGCVKIIGKPRRLLIMPLLLSVAFFIIMPFFVSYIGIFLFSVFSSLIFYFLLLLRQKHENKKQDRRQHELLRSKIAFNKPLVIIVLSLCFLSLFLTLRNSNISFSVALAGFFIVSYISFKEILEFNTKHNQCVTIISLVLGLVFLEIAWVSAFLPLESFSLTVILLSVAVALINIVEDTLNKKITSISLIKNLGIIVIAIMAVSVTTNWMLV
ncbi:hypothetical protein D4R87_01435 [bacterium]|nr:MAG: hypothetical protein D4R87_01435 [bacterium]